MWTNERIKEREREIHSEEWKMISKWEMSFLSNLSLRILFLAYIHYPLHFFDDGCTFLT